MQPCQTKIPVFNQQVCPFTMAHAKEGQSNINRNLSDLAFGLPIETDTHEYLVRMLLSLHGC